MTKEITDAELEERDEAFTGKPNSEYDICPKDGCENETAHENARLCEEHMAEVFPEKYGNQ